MKLTGVLNANKKEYGIKSKKRVKKLYWNLLWICLYSDYQGLFVKEFVPRNWDLTRTKVGNDLGTSRGSDRLSQPNGFFANAALKILFPEEAQKVECILRSAGLTKLADNVILRINRAAEISNNNTKQFEQSRCYKILEWC